MSPFGRGVVAFVLAAAALAEVGCGGDALAGDDDGDGAVAARVRGTGSSGLRVRARPNTASEIVGLLDEGASIAVTCWTGGESVEGNARWDLVRGADGWVSEAYVAFPDETRPPACTSAQLAGGERADAGGGGSRTDDAPPGAVVIEGPPVRPHVQAFADAACREVGACRATTREGHQPSGDLALDLPTGEGYGKLPTDGHAFGDRLADFARAHRAEFRIDYVIYRQRIDLGDGWEPMEDRGDITANHLDHVHVSFDP